MDLGYQEDIDTKCAGCGGDAWGWAFASDGRRVYVCPDCAEPLTRYTDPAEIGVAPHPRAQFCKACNRLTFGSDLSAQKRCPDCRGAARSRAQAENQPAPEDVPPEVAAAAADAQGAVEWDDESGDE